MINETGAKSPVSGQRKRNKLLNCLLICFIIATGISLLLFVFNSLLPKHRLSALSPGNQITGFAPECSEKSQRISLGGSPHPERRSAERSDCRTAPFSPLHSAISASVFQELRGGSHLAEIRSVSAVRSARQKFYILSVCHQKNSATS